MTVPRCSACNRIAIVEIDANVFLCRRCEIILKREFPNVARQLSDPVPTTALAVMPGSIEQAAKANPFSGADTAGTAAADAEPAPCIAAANQFPDMPKFLRRTAA